MGVILIIKTALGVFLGAVLQSYAGFGFGLFVLPLLLFLNYDFPTAVVIVIIGSGIQKIIGVRYFIGSFKWSELKPLFFFGLAGLPIGIFFLYKVSFFKPENIKQLIGIIIFMVLILRWSGISTEKREIHPIWGYIAGFFSGVLNGFANIGGPPVVIWVLSHDWSNEKMRSMIIALSLAFAPFQLAMIWIIFGEKIKYNLIIFAVIVPFVIAGSFLGLKGGDRLSKKKLTVLMESLLAFIAITAVLKPYL